MITITNNAKETIGLGEKLAGSLSKGDVVALSGDLGSGKTTFTKGIGKGLGVKEDSRINSPSFVLIKEYDGSIPLYHMDLYRLENMKEAEDIGLDEYIYGDGVTVIEWAERVKALLPKETVFVSFKIKDDFKREIRIEDLRG
ncbi:MAG: tRNA (adenosine(37)-N6)-threonylcarbamoyltransferase complex ATPase subunit type 1 TsaE [Candidatus Omnitrophota bacterium]